MIPGQNSSERHGSSRRIFQDRPPSGRPPAYPAMPLQPAQAVAIAPVPAMPTSLTLDIACRKCGYNLRGLGSDGRCPECGTPICVSTSGDCLQYCEPTWVKRLAYGATILFAGAAMILLDASSILVGVFLTYFRVDIGLELNILFWFVLAGYVGCILVVIGSWLLTTPDPSAANNDKPSKVARIIRMVLVVGVLSTAGGLMARFPTPMPPVIVIWLPVVAVFFGVRGGIVGVGIIGLFLQLQHLQNLGRRIPDAKLSSRAKFLKFAFVSCGLLLVIHDLCAAYALRGVRSHSILVVLTCIVVAISIAQLIFCIIYLLMIWRFSERFRKAMPLAKQHWAPAMPPPSVEDMISEIDKCQRRGRFAEGAAICQRVLEQGDAAEYHLFARNMLQTLTESADRQGGS